jgi:hypothetical protein|tara:strand:+ start:79 stop:570 length:492 start_codon:yes stop_codon:yes gene_type:complete
MTDTRQIHNKINELEETVAGLRDHIPLIRECDPHGGIIDERIGSALPIYNDSVAQALPLVARVENPLGNTQLRASIDTIAETTAFVLPFATGKFTKYIEDYAELEQRDVPSEEEVVARLEYVRGHKLDEVYAHLQPMVYSVNLLNPFRPKDGAQEHKAPCYAT